MKTKTTTSAEVLTITIGTKQLLSSLLFVGKAIAPNPIVVLLENVHVTIRPGEVEFRADDYSQSITTRMEYNHIGETGSFLLPHKKAVELLKTLPEAPITIQHVREEKKNDKGNPMIVCTITISFEEKKFKLASDDHIEFPKPQIFSGESIMVSAAQIREAFNICLTTVSIDTLRPAQCGIHFNTKKGDIVSCNGGNMTIFRTGVPLPTNVFTINTSFAKMVLEIIPSDQESIVLEVSDKSVRISNETQTITSQLIDERYVDYERALPQNNPLKATISLMDWLVVLRRSLIFSDSSFATKHTFLPDKLTIVTQDVHCESDSTQEIYYDGDVELEIGLQGKQISTILQKVSSKTARLEMSKPNWAVLIKPETTTAKELIILTMPIMLIGQE